MNVVHRCMAIGIGAMLGCAAIAPEASRGQNASEAGSLYSQGVHAYFAGRPGQAEMFMSRALASETGDPRLYYFRALSLMRMGRMDEARGDMMVGADLEAQRPGRFAIGTALQRVQGSNRLVLERYRRQGRANAVTNRERTSQARYSPTFDQESQVLRRRIIIPIDEFLRPSGPQPLSAAELAALPPFPPRSRVAPAPAGATPRAGPTVGEDPFRDDPQAGAAAIAPPTFPEGSRTIVVPNRDPESAAETEMAPEPDEEDPFSGL